MSSFYYLSGVFVAIVACAVAMAWATGTLNPIIIYFRTYFTEGQSAAEEKALDAMGESKVSYGIKGEELRQRTAMGLSSY